MKYRSLALLLAVVLLIGSLAGCADTGVQNYDGAEATATPSSTAGAADDTTAAAHDYAAARAKYPLDTVVMTVNGGDVTWGEYFYWLYYAISYVEQYLGTVTDFSAACSFDDTQTYAQYFVANAKDMVVQYHALEMNAKAAGAQLTEADEQSLADILTSDIASTCGENATEEDFYAYLDTVFVSRELYGYINSVSCLYKDCFDELYGAGGEKLPEADVQAFIDTNGYMTAKHILFSTVDSEGNALSDEDKAAKLAQAEDVKARLDAAADQDARLALFDELMTEFSEDTGLAYYPNGYCFASGDMEAAFETAAAALGDYELSDIVETDYGYHIILRLPTTPGDLVQYNSEDEQYDLRYLAAVDAYDVVVGNWISDAQVVWKPDFENLDLSKLFA